MIHILLCLCDLPRVLGSFGQSGLRLVPSYRAVDVEGAAGVMWSP